MEEPEVIINRKKNRPKKRKNKLVLVFDEDARREFLTGFHKRKLQRKAKAKEEFEKQLKLERKRIKAEAKEQYKKLLLSQKPIPELEDLLSEEIDMGTHSVSVTELSTSDLAKKNNWIGINQVQYEEKENNKEAVVTHKSKYNAKLERMEFGNEKKKKKAAEFIPKNCKDIKKAIKHKSTLNVKKSKIFQKKAQIEKLKNIKQQKRQEKKLKKTRKKDKRTKHKNKEFF